MAVYRTDVIRDRLMHLEREESQYDGSKSMGMGRDEGKLGKIHQEKVTLHRKLDDLVSQGREFELQPRNEDGSYSDDILEA